MGYCRKNVTPLRYVFLALTYRYVYYFLGHMELSLLVLICDLKVLLSFSTVLSYSHISNKGTYMGIYFEKIFHPIWPYLSLYDYQQFRIPPYMHFIKVNTSIAGSKSEDKICNSHRNYDTPNLFVTLSLCLQACLLLAGRIPSFYTSLCMGHQNKIFVVKEMNEFLLWHPFCLPAYTVILAYTHK